MEIMSPFVELEATMAGSAGAAIWDEHDTSIGRGRHLLGEYMSNAELVNTDMKEAAESAGYGLAVTLLYPKGAK